VNRRAASWQADMAGGREAPRARQYVRGLKIAVSTTDA